MSVSAQETVFHQVGNGLTVTFPFGCQVLQASDLQVYLNDVLMTSGFSISGIGVATGGSVTFDAPPADQAQVRLERVISLERSTDYQQNGDFLARVVNPDFNRLWMALQQHAAVFGRALLAPKSDATGPAPLPTIANRANKLLSFDANGHPVAVAPAAQSATALQALMAAFAGSSLVGFIHSGIGAALRTLQDKARDHVNAADYGALANGTNQTVAVQKAVDALGANGGEVQINRGTKFNLKSVVFPIRCNLLFWMDDDLSRPNPSTTLGTNERVLFAANANDGGIVNEWRYTASFHPTASLDVRKDVTGHDARLGPGQSRTDPVRASYNIFDEQVDTVRILFENHEAFSNFSGASMHAWRRVVTLSGIGTVQWGSLPPENTLVTGATSGAKGHVLSVSAGATTLLWFSGKFVAGEKLTDNNETTAATVTAVAFELVPLQKIHQDMKRGNWGVGGPAGAARHLWTVWGKIAATITRTSGQHVDEAVTVPSLVWLDNPEAATPSGFEAAYDCAPAVAARRITLRKLGETIDRAHLGAVRAFTNFGNTVLKADSSFNVASVVRNGTGDYTITFATPFARADYTVGFAVSDPMQHAYVFIPTVNDLRIRVVTIGTSNPVDINLQLHVSCMGGDI